MSKNKSKPAQPNPAAAKKSEAPSGPPFNIRLGLPEMEALWRGLEARARATKLSKDEAKLFNKWGKALKFLSGNPFCPSLQSHEISSLTKKYGKKVFESYLKNQTARGRADVLDLRSRSR